MPIPARRRPAAGDRGVGPRHQGRPQRTNAARCYRYRQDVHNGQRDLSDPTPCPRAQHNKTLAAQLYAEFKEFFPENAVHYFVSYYDYYQPEAYIPQRDLYIEKDASINSEIDRLRLATTSSLVSRRDVLIVASVSSIYGLGSPSDYKAMVVALRRGQKIVRDDLLLKFVDIQYDRNEISFERSKFRVRGDSIEVWPSYEEFAYRIELWGDEIESLSIIRPVSGEVIRTVDSMYLYPAKHFVMPMDRIQNAIRVIRAELAQQLAKFEAEGKLLEAQRLSARTRFDLEMLTQVGHCPGIENYSRPLAVSRLVRLLIPSTNTSRTTSLPLSMNHT